MTDLLLEIFDRLGMCGILLTQLSDFHFKVSYVFLLSFTVRTFTNISGWSNIGVVLCTVGLV